jgi:hypothetical protein
MNSAPPIGGCSVRQTRSAAQRADTVSMGNTFQEFTERVKPMQFLLRQYRRLSHHPSATGDGHP